MTTETARLLSALDALMEAALDERIAADSAVPDDAPGDLQLDDAEPRHRGGDWGAQRARDRFEMRNVKTEYGGI